MKRSVIARGAAGAAGVVAACVALSLQLELQGEARADDIRVAAPVSGPLCVLKGTYPLAKGTQLFDAPVGGRAVANFTGAFVPMQLSDFPADPTTGRVQLRTSTGSGALRIDGYVAASAIPVFTARDIPIAAGHVWISSAQRVKLVAASSNALTAEIAPLGTSGQWSRATAACDAFSLQQGAATAMEVPGNGRGYLTKGANVDFFDEPGGNAVFTLKMTENASHLFWSTESRAGFVHVQGRADLTLDAWVRQRDLEPLKKGEMMDQFIPPTTAVQGAQLSLDKPPRVVQATKELPIRFKRDEKEKPIGVLEVGAEVYVMETVAGWSNVLPKNLAMMPPEDGGFWIPAGEVPKG